ncbi:hypothetical protein E1301_Tti004971 [Triplophysa tibetana]|uniref:TNFR-Cys domain-containing protein n=1 Tax=Triplophysa tibetana TaxID=1572043 RepID=A0A5A9NRM9_9TELE|nr:hypothetical protein E1301_Tti004971 [Triplophysa tibetana]
MNIYGKDKCKDCPNDQYSPNEGEEIACSHCSKCGHGSEEEVVCTPTSDARCRCKKGFTPLDTLKKKICFCQVGYGVDLEGNNCIECKHGFFSNERNSVCQKWKEACLGIRCYSSADRALIS